MPPPLPSSPFAKLVKLVEAPPTEDDFLQRVVDAPHAALQVDDYGRISFEGEVLGKLVRGADRLSPGVALVDADVWNGGQRARLERRLAACARDVVAEAMGGFPAQTLSSEARPPPLRALAWRFASGLGVVRRDEEVMAQVRLLDAESHHSLDAHGVRQGARYFVVERAVTPVALLRRALLTEVASGQLRPAGVPQVPVLGFEALGDVDAAPWGYEWVGPFALRVDALEALLAVQGDAPRLERTLKALQVDAAARGALVKHLARLR